MSGSMPVHPIVMADGRVPCDCCDALIGQAEAEAHFPAWQQMLCDHCAGEYAAANPTHASKQASAEPRA